MSNTETYVIPTVLPSRKCKSAITTYADMSRWGCAWLELQHHLSIITFKTSKVCSSIGRYSEGQHFLEFAQLSLQTYLGVSICSWPPSNKSVQDLRSVWDQWDYTLEIVTPSPCLSSALLLILKKLCVCVWLVHSIKIQTISHKVVLRGVHVLYICFRTYNR